MRLRDVGRFACRAPVLFMKKGRPSTEKERPFLTIMSGLSPALLPFLRGALHERHARERRS